VKVLILPSAEQDLGEGADFYASQRDDKLGKYFISCLTSDIDTLARYGGIHETHLGYQRMLAKRFPYAIYYKLVDETVKIYAVLDCRQNSIANDMRLKSLDGFPISGLDAESG
jgi:plasmid stabilization system protein ParE